MLLQTVPQALPDMAEEVRAAFSAAATNPRLAGGTEAAPAVDASPFSKEVEEEANGYFQKIYTGQQSIAEVVELLRQFQASSLKHEKDVFGCMLHNLFDEYRFFNKYPDKELRITALLFGSLIHRGLVSGPTLTLALRFVIESLRKPPGTKLHAFGCDALEQFKSRLVEWPAPLAWFTQHLAAIPHLRASHPELLAFLARTDAGGGAAAGPGSAGGGAQSMAQQQAAAQQAAEALDALSLGQAERAREASDAAEHQWLQAQQQAAQQRAASGLVPAGGGGLYGIAGLANPAAQVQPHPPGSLRDGVVPWLHSRGCQTCCPSACRRNAAQPTSCALPLCAQVSGGGGLGMGGVIGDLPRPLPAPSAKLEPSAPAFSPAPSFATALNIETLLAASENRTAAPPDDSIVDKLHFLCNNLSASNLDVKARDVKARLPEAHWPWFATYLVVKRASIEPNFHSLYLGLLEQLAEAALTRTVLNLTHVNIKARPCAGRAAPALLAARGRPLSRLPCRWSRAVRAASGTLLRSKPAPGRPRGH